jgi:short-chain fatty acids transporter
MLAATAMIVGCWLNWGFGLIASALLARELARRVPGVHYPLLVASAYSGFVVWHAGLSGSIPLKIAGVDEIMSRFAGGVTVPASQTIFAWQNLLLVLVFLATVPLLNALMHPRRGEEIVVVGDAAAEGSAAERAAPEPGNAAGAATGDRAAAEAGALAGADAAAEAGAATSPARRLEESRILSLMIGAICIAAIAVSFARGGRIDLDSVIFVFLTLGILLHKTPIRYVRAVNEAVRSCGGIVLQFPIYAGIMGMMIESGLAVSLSELFVRISTRSTFPLFTFLSAGIVNIFVPSGGGQWAVQGPIMIPAATALGVPYATTAMAIAWGDAWTNLVQPFWALPLLAVARLHIRDIMGYTAVILIFTGIVTSLFMLCVF